MLSRRCLAASIALSLLAASAALGDSAGTKPPIQDNSFLIEEAYNQEKGVVQHVSTFARGRSGDWLYTFTQEWPLRGLRHQLSFTIPLAGVAVGPSRGEGLGDLALNYRLQLAGSGASRIAVAPRLSLLLPTGDERAMRGSGGAGLQFNLPVSWALSDKLVSHFNLGATHTPRARSAGGDRAPASGWNAGHSVIYQPRSRFNVMLELAYTRTQEVAAPGRARWRSDLQLSPGLRWAHDFGSGLQIVPGIALPIGIGPSEGELGLFVYLSFEHPFSR
jgi:hypothetical protein